MISRVLKSCDEVYRIAEFESIRGLAALSVALFHSFIVLRPDGIDGVLVMNLDQAVNVQAFLIVIAQVIFNGPAAVMVFFVLSGLVLGMSLDRYAETDLMRCWVRFMIARSFRIYPAIIPVIFGVLLFLYGFHKFKYFPETTSWYASMYQFLPTEGLILRSLLLRDDSLDAVMWTLRVEMAVAIVFPLVHAFSRRTGFLLNLLALPALVFVSFIFPPDYLMLHHLYKFYAGLLLSDPRLQNWIKKPPRKFELGFDRFLRPMFIFGIALLLSARLLFPGRDQLLMLVETIGAFFILLPFLYGNELFSWMKSRVLLWFGKISYSFYLWHFVVMYVIAELFLQQDNWRHLYSQYTILFGGVLGVTSVGLTSILAHMSYKYVERPSILMCRKILAS